MARLTASQLTTLKNHLAANTATVTVGRTPFAINAIGVDDRSDEAAQRVADWYNLVASPAFSSWNPAAVKDLVAAAVTVSNFTPADSPPSSPSTDMTYQNRALLCQLKQSSAFFLTTGTVPIDARSSGARANFRDCLTSIPSGTNGANQNAGWGSAANPGATNLALQHLATNAEKAMGTTPTGAGNDGTSTLGDPKNPGSAGTDSQGAAIVSLASQDIKDAWSIG